MLKHKPSQVIILTCNVYYALTRFQVYLELKQSDSGIKQYKLLKNTRRYIVNLYSMHAYNAYASE